MYLMFAVVSVTIGQANVEGFLPDRLQQVMESQKAKTSRIEWTITHLDKTDAGLVERHITQTVGDTTWQVNLGDENGYHWTSYLRSPSSDSEEDRREAEVPKEEIAGPWHSLVHDGLGWYLEHQKRRIPLGGRAVPKDKATSHRPFQFAAAGLRVSWLKSPRNMLGLRESLLEGVEGAAWSVSSHGNIDTVTAEFEGKALQWHLDKTRGDKPVHGAFYVGNEMHYASYSELVEIDGRWLPSSMSFYEGDSEQPYKVIEVQKATFDKPEHIQEITPEDIGVRFGSQLYCADRLCTWDGTGLISYIDEFYDLLFIYGLRPGPTITQRQAELGGRTVEEQLAYWDRTMEQKRARYLEEHGEAPWLAKKSDEPDPWDLYVAEFIKKHKLDEPRIKQANDILKKAKKLRDYHQRKNRSEIAKARRARDEEKLAHYEQISERIFQKVLVYRLEKLVPREQKKALETGT